MSEPTPQGGQPLPPHREQAEYMVGELVEIMKRVKKLRRDANRMYALTDRSNDHSPHWEGVADCAAHAIRNLQYLEAELATIIERAVPE